MLIESKERNQIKLKQRRTATLLKLHHVCIVDRDFSARMFISSLLIRDLRTTAHVVCPNIATLTNRLPSKHKIDTVLLGIEGLTRQSLVWQLHCLHELLPDAQIILLSEIVPSQDMIALALKTGVEGILIKEEVGPAIATAVIQAEQTGFVFSASIEPLIAETFPRWTQPEHKLERWRLHPSLTPAHLPVFRDGLLFGLTAKAIAYEYVEFDGNEYKPVRSKSSVQRYRYVIYDILRDGFYDTEYLNVLDDVVLSSTRDEGGEFYGEDWAWHILTQPPNPEHPLFEVEIDTDSIDTMF